MVVASVHQLGALVRGRREELGATQAEIAASAGVSRKTLSELETGRAAPRFASLLQVIDALGLHLIISPPDTPEQRPTGDGAAGAVSLDQVLDRYRPSKDPDGG